MFVHAMHCVFPSGYTVHLRVNHRAVWSCTHPLVHVLGLLPETRLQLCCLRILPPGLIPAHEDRTRARTHMQIINMNRLWKISLWCKLSRGAQWEHNAFGIFRPYLSTVPFSKHKATPSQTVPYICFVLSCAKCLASSFGPVCFWGPLTRAAWLRILRALARSGRSGCIAIGLALISSSSDAPVCGRSNVTWDIVQRSSPVCGRNNGKRDIV